MRRRAALAMVGMLCGIAMTSITWAGPNEVQKYTQELASAKMKMYMVLKERELEKTKAGIGKSSLGKLLSNIDEDFKPFPPEWFEARDAYVDIIKKAASNKDAFDAVINSMVNSPVREIMEVSAILTAEQNRLMVEGSPRKK